MSNIPSTNAIHIARPAPKTVSEVQVPPKAYLNFQFSLQGAATAKNGDDLVIDLPDGSKVVCLGYYSNNAEGDRPQIAVNGEALPPSALDIGFFTQQVEGVRLQGTPEGQTEGEAGQAGQAGQPGQPGQADAAGADGVAGAAGGKAPASSGATATGESAGDGGDGTGAAQGAGAASGQAGQSGQAAAGEGSSSTGTSTGSSSASSTGSSSSTGSASFSGSSSSGSSGSFSTEGSFKQDHNVDFLGGINRLPGLDIGSDRGFNNTDIEGGPTGGIIGGTTTPPPPPPPVIPSPPAPTPPPLPNFSAQVSGLTEEGTHKGAVTTVGTKDASHTFSLTLPDGMELGDVRLNASLLPGAPSGALSPNTVYPSNYGDFSYSLTSKNVPVLDAAGKPVVDADGKAVFRTEVEVTLRYENLNNDHEDINSLPAGGKLDETLSFTVTGKDASGNNTTLGKGDVTFVIEGSNDGPVLAKDAHNLAAHFEVKEEGVYAGNTNTTKGDWDEYDNTTLPTDPDFGTYKDTTTIQLGVQDGDKGDVLTYTLTEDPATGKPGVSISGEHMGKPVTMVKNADGTYTLQIDGVSCGTLTFSPSGLMTFTLDSNASIIQSMKAGEFSDLKLNVTVTDKGGLSDSGDITLTIHGTNDRPIFTPGQTFVNSITESGDNVTHHTVTGKLQGFDPEGDVVTDQTLNFYVKDSNGAHTGTVDGKYGSLVLNPDGSYTYTENGSLRTDENKSDRFTVVVKDHNGAYTEQELVFNVKGLNNTVQFPDLDGANYVIKLVEEGVQTGGNKPNDGTAPGDMQAKNEAKGYITKFPGKDGKDFIVDDDASAGGPNVAGARTYKLTASSNSSNDLVINSTTPADGAGWQTIETNYGTFNFNIYSGEYTYTLKDVGYLTKNDVKTEIFTVEVNKDGVVQGSRDFSVTIRGMNDKPEFTDVRDLVVKDKGSENTDFVLGDGSKALSRDVDTGDQATLKYTIEHRSDPANPAEVPSLVQVTNGTYGVLYLNSLTGEYTYELDNTRAATKALGQNERGIENFTIRVTDTADAYDTKTIKVTVNGAYDKPSVSYARNTVKEDNGTDQQVWDPNETVTTSGSINVSTTDTVHKTGQTFSVIDTNGNLVGTVSGSTQTITTQYGVLTFNMVTGAYDYVLTAAGNKLMQRYNIDGWNPTEIFNVRVTFTNDGNQTVDATLNIDLKGVNDAPEFVHTDAFDTPDAITRTDFGTAGPKVTGIATAEDVDDAAGELFYCFKVPKGAGFEYVQTIETDFGTVTINAKTGAYEYTLNNQNGTIAGLQPGQSKNDHFDVVVRDPHGAEDTHKVTIIINGKDNGTGSGPNDSNDLPNFKLEVKEDSGGMTTRPDGGDTVHGQIDQSGVGGSIGNNSDGTVIRYCFKVTKDGNDVMVQSMQGKYGTIYIDAYTGQYRYVLDNQHSAVQALASWDITSELFQVYTFTIKNGAAEWLDKATAKGTITVEVKGANDDPELTAHQAADALTVYAGSKNVTTTGKFTAKDDDVSLDTTKPETMTFGLSALEPGTTGTVETSLTLSDSEGNWGTVTIDSSTGQYVFNYDPENKFLTGSKTLTFWVFVKDRDGAIDKEEVTITINGVNTKPVIVGCSYTDGSGATYAYGSDPKLTVDSTDGSILQNGNELSGVTQTALAVGMHENATTPSITGKFASWDNEVDNGPLEKTSYNYFLCNASGGALTTLDIGSMGTLELGKGGTFTFTLNSQADVVKALKEGELSVLHYYVVVRDANGLYSEPQKFDVTITGTNNVPDITATQGQITLQESGNVIDDAHKYKLELVDPDLDTTVQSKHDFILSGTATLNKGTAGTLTVSQDKDITSNAKYEYEVSVGGVKYGIFHIEVNPDNAKDVKYWFEVDVSMADYLTKNDNVTLTFKLQFNDGSKFFSVSNEAMINVVIQGNNNVPTITGLTDITMAETGNVTPHNFTITDGDFRQGEGYGFALTGKCTLNDGTAGNLTVSTAQPIVSGGFTEYTYEVLTAAGKYGTFHVKVDTADPRNSPVYWFEVNPDLDDRLFTGDSAKLDFTLTYNDGFGGKGSANVTITITGDGARDTTTTSVSVSDGADMVPASADDEISAGAVAHAAFSEAASVVGALGEPADDMAADLTPNLAPDFAKPVVGLESDVTPNAAPDVTPVVVTPPAGLVPDLAAPDVVLPGGTLAETILNEALADVGLDTANAPNVDVAGAVLPNADVAGVDLMNTDLPSADTDAAPEHASGDAPAPLATQPTADAQGNAAGASSGPNTGSCAAPNGGPLTLETPLSYVPMQDMTSAPGQEALQFQLQTTGV